MKTVEEFKKVIETSKMTKPTFVNAIWKLKRNQSAESNDSLISLSKNFKNIQEQIKNTQEHSRTMKNTQEQMKNTIAFRENISNLYNALGEESI
ncbi:hypothetical protein LXL04_002719 [Taraxacum kok-saghyz]